MKVLAILFLIQLFSISPVLGLSNHGGVDEAGMLNITLITGDTVAAHNISGKVTYSILPSKTGISRNYQIIKSPQGTYFIPDDADLKRVDMELFNIDYLLEEGYDNLGFIPVMMTFESIPDRKKGIGAQGIMGLDKARGIKISNIHERIGVAAARLDKEDTGYAFNSLQANKDISKIWLDKKRHISLSDSVPLIGAPTLWAQGYNGSGVKIAILDTGIDATHPDLDDIDDNPLTNDPKVQVQRNFVDWTYTDISDNTTNDLFGHGTHVSSIAAGTGEASGGLYRGVAPGAYLWNLRVLNKYGSGYDSWIINGINYAAYGADAIPHTGDEADIISMSLGGGPADGDDPMSRAVNNAIDAGVVVTIAAGNCGNLCISTPGAADKVITVGATDKSDNLAWFSSRGPTLDYRVKPDVAAPGVNIVAAMASGTSMGSPVNSYYTSASGTSMATPHVAGAAALILQKAKDSIPGWILETPQHYNAFPVSYNWIDGITGGTSGGIYGDDVATGAIDVGFNFTFYGTNYSKLYFSTNGLITFDNPSISYGNVPIPNPAQPNNFIAPFWDDLNVVNGTGDTYYKLDAISNPKKFIITWKNVYRLGYSNPATLQAVLFSNGSFLFQYQNISNIGVFDQTIGAENSDGSEGIQYVYSYPLANQSAVMFLPKIAGLGKPKYVKNVLISTAKDLSLSVYEQGGGRIQIPNASRDRIIADPATVSFKIITGINTGVITFYNLNTTSSRTLNFNVAVRDLSGSIVNAASLNTNSLTIAPNSSASVLLTVNAASISASIYSGKLTALADNGEKAGVIFGFSKLNKLTINKIKFAGTYGTDESIWVYGTDVTNPNDYFSRFVMTNSSGTAIVYVPDGEYNIWSGNFPRSSCWSSPDADCTWIWTTKDKFSVTGDTSTALDERLSVPVSFDPNKPNQKFAALYSNIYSEDISHSWELLYGYPLNTTTRFTPTSDYMDNRYEYYPAAYYNSSDSGRINTPEWYDLYYFEHGINSPKNYVADYSKLVRRNGVYNATLINESAWRAECAENKSIFNGFCFSFAWLIDLPQQRIEYITPDTYYWGSLRGQSWYFYDWGVRNYSEGSTPYESWNTQPYSWHHIINRGSNWLDIYAYAFMDTSKHVYGSTPIPSNFTLYRNGIKIYNISTDGNFQYHNLSEAGAASYSAVIEGASNQNLALRSRTVLNFSYTGSGDYKPPKIFMQIPKLDMYNRLLSNTAEINLSVVEEKENGFVNGTPDQLSSLSLEYSVNEGSTWNAITLNSLGDGEYNATISGLPDNTFVSLRAKAVDNSGNSASHELIKAFLRGYQFELLPAQFNDVYSHRGLDTDGNGFYDYLAINVGVNVNKAGYYQVIGSLYNSSGWYIDSTSNYTTLNAGNQTVQLRFNGARIWQSRTNGTFDLRYLYLYNASDWKQLDYRYYAYTTDYYNYTDFWYITPTPVSSPESRYVWDAALGANLTYTWTPMNFDGLFYDVDNNVGNESLTIRLDSNTSRIVQQNNLIYSTNIENVSFKYRPWGSYSVIGFMGEKYFAGYTAASIGLTSTPKSTINSKQLHKILMDDDTQRVVSAGSTLTLQEGYIIKIRDVDASGRIVLLSLLKEGSEIDTQPVLQGGTYVYSKNVTNMGSLLIIAVHVDSIFSGREVNASFIKGIFQISESYKSVNTGNRYGIMEITGVSDKGLSMKNADSIYLGQGSTIDIMGYLNFKIADSEILRFYPVNFYYFYYYYEYYSKNYERRGAVFASSNNITAWDALNFAGLWYDLDTGSYSETLKITNLSGRVIHEGNLDYTSSAIRLTYIVTQRTGKTPDVTDGTYTAIGLGGDKYAAIKGKTNKLTRIILEQGTSLVEKKTITVSETWDMGDGYTLTAQSIDAKASPRLAWLVLRRNGVSLDDRVVQQGSIYTYIQKNLDGESDVPIFITYIDSVFAGATTDMVQLRYTWLVSDNVTEIKAGDSIGVFNVTKVEPASIVLKNDNSISLDAGSTVELMGTLNFNIADSNNLRFYPFKEPLILGVNASPNRVKLGTPTNVLITVTSHYSKAVPNGTLISNATVMLSGAGVSVSGLTNSSGQVVLAINATMPENILITASKTFWTSGKTSIAVMPSQDVTVIRINNYTVMLGSNVLVPVWLDNGSIVAGGSFKVTFNSSMAEAMNAGAGDFGTPTYNIDNAGGFVYIAAAQATASGKNTAILANITFNIPAGVSSGASTVLGLQQTVLTSETGGSVAHATVNGSIKIEGVRGDVNRNGRRDTGDATLILRNSVGLPIPSQYLPILPIGDMNCDSRIDTGDATLVMRDVVSLPIPRCWE